MITFLLIVLAVIICLSIVKSSSDLPEHEHSRPATYQEAINVCRSFDKKVPQQTRSDEFGAVSCEWTPTETDRHSLFTVQPMLFDVWAEDEDKNINMENMVTYGSKITFYNAESNKYMAISHSQEWVIEPVHTECEGPIARGAMIYLFDPHTKGRLAANITVPGPDPQSVLVTTYLQQDALSDCQWRVQPIDDDYWHNGGNVRLQHVTTGKVLYITDDTAACHGTIALGSQYNHRSKWTTKVIGHEVIVNKMQQYSMYLNQIVRARQLAQTSGPTRDAAMKSASQLIDRFNRECYEIPRQAYDRAIWKIYAEIREQLNLLVKETRLFRNYHGLEVALCNNIKQQQILMRQKEDEKNQELLL